MAHFYFIAPDQIPVVGGNVVLTGPEARHAGTVSRMRAGESIQFGDGYGLVGSGQICAVDKDKVSITVVSVTQKSQNKPDLILVQALAKTDRDERAIEASTELGVDTVIPWAATRSVSRWDSSKAEKGRLRWESIVKEASKQSMRDFIPHVTEVSTITEVIQRLSGSQILVLDPTGQHPISQVHLHENSIAVVVGPEGGLAPAEIEEFSSAGALIVTMGTNILRTSTAGPGALAVINSRLGRF